MKPTRCRIWVLLRPPSRPKLRFGQGATGVAMSGPMRCRYAAVLILAGLLIAGILNAPASANILDTLFNRTPEDASAPAQDASAKDASAKQDAAAKDECLSRPGKPAEGQHWMYRLDGHRRCWFSVPEEAATVRKRAHHPVA